MAVTIYANIAGGGVNWREATTATPADNATDVEVRVTDTGSYTPTKHEVAIALRRLIGYLASQEGGAWPLA